MLGTYVDIRIASSDTEALSDHVCETAFDAAFAAIAQCERLMSFHDHASELSRINRADGGEVIDVHPWTAQVLAHAVALFDLTHGTFDAGVGAQLVGWGLLPPASDVCPRRYASLADIECVPDPAGGPLRNAVRVLRRTCLDLGGIAKGFAVDRATDALRAQGVSNAIINAGGDLRVLGHEPHDIHVRDPRLPSTLIRVGELADGALATSSPYFSRQRFRQAASEVCALVDAHRREPLLDARSYTVIAPECWMADALTKVLAAGVPPGSPCFSHYRAQTLIL